ncbi:MAG: hypothetical protein HN733_03020 [Gammaproteobacteria bacterium]|nr:hypothetical protein [Gammaproteobacteria bacterium]
MHRNITLSSLLLMTLITSCSTTRVDEEVNLPFELIEGQSIVILSDSYHTGNKTEIDFMNCLNKNLKRKQNKFNLIPTNQFKDDFYPWFEPSTAPQNAEQLPKFLKKQIIKNKLENLKIKYIVNVTGETTTNSSSGALSCAAGPGGGGCFGFAWWDDTSSYSASVWDLNEAIVVGNVSATVTGTSVIPAIVIPIPILARTQSNACQGLSDQILAFFS